MFYNLMKEFEYKTFSNWLEKMKAADIRFIKCARNPHLNQRQCRSENVCQTEKDIKLYSKEKSLYQLKIES